MCRTPHLHPSTLPQSHRKPGGTQVVIEYPAAGEYTVDIDARFLFFAAVPQPYSIAVSGWPAGAGGGGALGWHVWLASGG